MRPFTLGLIAAIIVSGPAMAQDPIPMEASLNAGVAEYDLSGVDTAPLLALRGGAFLSRHLSLEGSFGYAAVDQQFGQSRLYLPELQAQLSWPLGRVAPYLGMGGGAAIDAAEDPEIGTDTDATFSASIGMRVGLPARVGVRAEVRARAIGTDFTASGGELTAGMAYRF